MKKLLLFIFSFVSTFNATAQWVSGGTQISTSADEHHRAFVSSAGGGAYYVTWNATDTTAAGLGKIMLSACNGTGTLRNGWTVGGNVISQAGDHYAPQIITSEDSGAIVAWYGYDSTLTISHIYVQKYSSAGIALWNSGNPVQVSTGTIYNHKYPIITSDKNNGVYISWVRYDNANSASSPDVFLQRIDQNGNVASGWSASATSVAVNAGVRECDPRVSLTPDLNSVYVVYASGLIGNTSLILKKFDSSNGNLTAGWSTNGVTISAGPYVYPQINHDLSLFSDNANNAVVFWLESRTSANGELYQQQISGAGNILLTANGILQAGNTANGIDYLEVSQESDFDFLIAYNNLETFNDVATMKVRPNSSVIWHDIANTTGGYSAYPMPVSDGNKGMFVFYKKTGSPDKLYGFELDSTGTMTSSFTLPGSAFGNIGNYDGFDPNYDLNPVATNVGEAVVAWNRKTSNNLFSIFTCNLLSNGTTCTTNTMGIGENNSPTNLFSVYPNPFENQITISTNSILAGEMTLKVFDINGKLIEESKMNSSDKTILSTEKWNCGMYFYQVLNENEIVQSGKIIRE